MKAVLLYLALFTFALLCTSGCRTKRVAVQEKKDVVQQQYDSASAQTSRRDTFILNRLTGRKAEIDVSVIEFTPPDSIGRIWPARITHAKVRETENGNLTATGGVAEKKDSTGVKAGAVKDKTEIAIKETSRPGPPWWWLLVGGVIAALLAYLAKKYL